MTDMDYDGVRQIEWSAFRRGISWSHSPHIVWHRFSITENTSDYTVSDHERKDGRTVMTLATARAWAGIRVNERAVRHEPRREDGA